MDIETFETIIDTFEALTEVLLKETYHVRQRDLAEHQDVIDEKARLVARINRYHHEYHRDDFEQLSPTTEHRERYDAVRADFAVAFKENGVALAAANRLYDIMLETISQAHYNAQARPIGYSNDNGRLKTGKEVYDHVGGSAVRFSAQF